MDGVAGGSVWSHLLTGSQGPARPERLHLRAGRPELPESLRIWHNGRQVFSTAANTGIPASPTVDGTFPVYTSLLLPDHEGHQPRREQVRRPVYYVSYFNGGDAVHYFSRYSLRFYQSLGCVEVPWIRSQDGVVVADLRQPRHRHRPGLLRVRSPGQRSVLPDSNAGRSFGRTAPHRCSWRVTAGALLPPAGPSGRASGVLNPLVLLKGTEAVDLDGGVVDEDVS